RPFAGSRSSRDQTYQPADYQRPAFAQLQQWVAANGEGCFAARAGRESVTPGASAWGRRSGQNRRDRLGRVVADDADAEPFLTRGRDELMGPVQRLDQAPEG